jgi:hypothetical protein
MNIISKIFIAGFSIITALFVFCSFALIFFSIIELWHAINPEHTIDLRERFNSILETIGLLTIAVASLELGQTILEEEVKRNAEMSAPTRVRRFLSRFLIVIVVSLSIEFLVAVFELIHQDTSKLPQVSYIGFATAALLAAWGIFVRFNKTAEELEPEAMEKVKREDDKVR